MTVCVDASFALKVVLLEPGQASVRAQFAEWDREGVAIIAPPLWAFEAHSVLYRKTLSAALTREQALQAWDLLRRRIRSVSPRGLFERAWLIADQLNRPVIYDAFYVAVAQLRRCELWTADQRLVNAAAGKLPWIRSI